MISPTATIPLEFTARCNGNRCNTYQTDFTTGRSWVEPASWLRYYKDGGVSLHITGYRSPHVRGEARRHGIEIETFHHLRGTLTTPSGEKVPRRWLRSASNTVLMSGDRVYPLHYHKNTEKSGMTRLPPAQLLANPLAVWQDRGMQPVCSSIHTVYVESKDRYDKWMDLHGDKLKVARVLGAMAEKQAYTPNMPQILVKLTTTSEQLSDTANSILFRAPKAELTAALMYISAEPQEHPYLILNPA